MEIKIFKDKDLEDLILFEKNIRKTEPEVWDCDFDDVVMRDKFVDYKRLKDMAICVLYVENCIVARCDYHLIHSMMDFETTAYVDWLYVDKNYRRQGFGKKLMSFALEHAKNAGASSCYLFTASNPEATAYYEHYDGLKCQSKTIAYKNFY